MWQKMQDLPRDTTLAFEITEHRYDVREPQQQPPPKGSAATDVEDQVADGVLEQTEYYCPQDESEYSVDAQIAFPP